MANYCRAVIKSPRGTIRMSNDEPVGWLDVIVADLVEDLLEVGDGLPRLLLQILPYFHNIN
jgi:hypothetical protein